MEITFSGEYGLPLLLSGLLAMVYKFAGENLSNRVKVVAAVGIGIALGLLAIPYNAEAWSFRNVFDHVLYGFVTGTSASGTYEFYRGVAKPRA